MVFHIIVFDVEVALENSELVIKVLENFLKNFQKKKKGGTCNFWIFRG